MQIIFYILAFVSLGILVGFLLLWRKISHSSFQCSRCRYSYTPLIYKPTWWTFGLQGLFYRFYILFLFWLPVFFGKIIFRCPNCKKISWHSLVGPRKGIIIGGIVLFLCVIIFPILIFSTIIFLKNGLPEGLPKEEGTPYIQVISPNGGEELIAGETYDITWESRGIDKITITLCYEREKGYEGCLVEPLEGTPAGINANFGKFTWQINPNILYYMSSYVEEYSDNFVVIIRSVENRWVFDKSDGFFSIIQR